MGVKTLKPVTPGRRHVVAPDMAEVTRRRPEKSLTVALRKKSGRNNQGRICVRHRGGGVKRRYRIIDFRRDKYGVPGTVRSIEYDPNRSARIALIQYRDGEKRYIIAPRGLGVGNLVSSGDEAAVEPGSTLPLQRIPEGSFIYNLELTPGKGGQLVRAAGAAAQLMSKERRYATVKLPSGELRLFEIRCRATVGQVGNVEHSGIQLGKAGAARKRGRRPHVRGVAMNPIDHPHGGGEGRSGPGRNPVSPWGWPTKGHRTRRKNKASDRLIVQRRKRR